MEEKIIDIAGKEYFLIPSYRNLRRMEVRLNEPFMVTAGRLERSEYGFYDIASIIFCLIDESEKVSFDKIAEGIVDKGLVKCYNDVVLLFVDVIKRGTEGSERTENPPKVESPTASTT